MKVVLAVSVALFGVVFDLVRAKPSDLPHLVTAMAGCMHDGKWYPEGGSNNNPCMPCHCYQGRMVCAIVDCFFTPCVDSVRDPTKCCPICPNGPNCRAPDGTVIPANGTVRLDADTTCKCDSHGALGFMSMNAAVCSKTAHLLALPPAPATQ